MSLLPSRYDGYPIFQIEDARRGKTYGRIPRRALVPATTHVYRVIPPNWSPDVAAAQTQGSAYNWWRIMDLNVEYMYPWEIMTGDIIRLPTLT